MHEPYFSAQSSHYIKIKLSMLFLARNFKSFELTHYFLGRKLQIKIFKRESRVFNSPFILFREKHSLNQFLKMIIEPVQCSLDFNCKRQCCHWPVATWQHLSVSLYKPTEMQYIQNYLCYSDQDFYLNSSGAIWQHPCVHSDKPT